jgi:hypothetical protein
MSEINYEIRQPKRTSIMKIIISILVLGFLLEFIYPEISVPQDTDPKIIQSIRWQSGIGLGLSLLALLFF